MGQENSSRRQGIWKIGEQENNRTIEQGNNRTKEF
jgi:hypothetical protein